MLVKYINKAMSQAVYDKLEDGSFCGKIPECPGVLAFADSLYHCQEVLQSVLEGWLIVKLRHGDKLPVQKTEVRGVPMLQRVVDLLFA